MPARPASQLEKPSQPTCQPPARGDPWRSNQSTSMQVRDKDQGPPLSRHPLITPVNQVHTWTSPDQPKGSDHTWKTCPDAFQPLDRLAWSPLKLYVHVNFTRSAKKIKKGCFMAFDGLGSMVEAQNGSQLFNTLTTDKVKRLEKAELQTAASGSKFWQSTEKGEQQYGDGVSLYFDELVPHGSNLLPGKVFPEGPKGSCHAILSNPAWVTHLLRTVVLNWYVEMHLTCKTTTTAAAATTTTKTKGRNTIKTIYIYITVDHDNIKQQR